ncbi:MAG: serine/threonine protein kinase [Myxococcales bacterium]|nr:serine/threonine protein kinase [Myxococcales bacterium]
MLAGGTRVGDYEIEAELGEGGMAKVYRARHALLDTLHAIKVLDAELRTNADARQRFLDEARIQAKHLDHPGIVKVTNIVATSEYAALVMELVEGGSLETYAASVVNDPGEVRRIMLSVLDAVGHAHAAGIVHRDLKPANVLLAGAKRIPKVTDFGIAKVNADPSRISKKSTHAGARMGTLSYMSPEQIRRAKDVTPRSDIFSLGAMLYELATGAVPFDGVDDFEVMEKIVHGRFPPPADKNPGSIPRSSP